MSGKSRSTSLPAGAQRASYTFANYQPTRTQETEVAYLSRATSLVLRATREGCGNTGPLTCTAHYLLANRKQWLPNTWRQYRAALRFACSTENSHDARNAAQLLDQTLGSSGEELPGNGNKKISERKTSALRSKTVREKNIERIVNAIEASRAKPETKETLIRWIIYGYFTGLRPCEWGNARVVTVDGDARLEVANAKHTNGRAHGLKRTIPLQHFPETELDSLHEFCDKMHRLKNSGQFESKRGTCSKLLQNINRRLYGKGRLWISLYSMRHGFSSRVKVSCTPPEVAALMGHASDATASLHYGKRRHGGGGLPIKPLKDEVARVRNNFKPCKLNYSEKSKPTPSRQRPKPTPYD
ncbi:MAG: site-specific integrase [Rhodocyclaceae bacterium]|nr:site-specific integrase [Rhodocyclaceae bacterium]